ncbi:hypothetical protein [Neomegalonema sp.]|uniref:hypothetical protein n=1 Tax=Neomegalonema sp. TaxID=2039713 RepID=UPI00260528ED|nr:hypothetical protein [Neomegalonema sp.]MDD2867182.1 hypothetical protein [Neomegalonema sp.]
MKPVLASAAGLALALGLAACASIPATPVPQDDLPESLRPYAPEVFVPPPGAFVLLNPDVPLGEAAVWRGSASAADPCRAPAGSGRTEPTTCLVEGLQAAGAASPAVAAARWLSTRGDPGYLSGWRREGPVGIATVTRPLRANTNVETVLVPPGGEALFIDEAPALGFETDAIWTGFKAKQPNAFPVPPFELVASERHLLGWRLAYGVPLRDCRACADAGRMLVAYDFDSSGRFKERRLLSID